MPDESFSSSSNIVHPPFRKLLLLAAMEAELQAVLSQASFMPEVISQGLKLTLHLHTTSAITIGVACCGVGPVNAGAALALLCDKTDFDAALLIGIAGALSPSLHTGQLVLSNEIIQHDSVAAMPEGTFFILPGEPHLASKGDNFKSPATACADALVNYLHSIVADDPALKPVVGPVLSGSEFTSTKERKRKLAARFPGSLSIDMEAAGAALIAKRLKLPFVAAKIVADELEHELSPADFKRVAKEAFANITLFVNRLFAALS
jgi:adenosylhomocysteine nucleosidase